MTIGYGTPTPSTTTRHDHIYTTLLGVGAFFVVLGMLNIAFLRQRLVGNPVVESVLRLTFRIEGAYLFVMVIVLLIRLVFPKYRQWPTLGLNIILLMLFPFGTALAIYGFWKVDKRFHSSRIK